MSIPPGSNTLPDECGKRWGDGGYRDEERAPGILCHFDSLGGFYSLSTKGSEFPFAISTGKRIKSFPTTNNRLDRATTSRYRGKCEV